MTRDHLHDTLPDQPAEVVEDMEATPPRDGARMTAPPVDRGPAPRLEAVDRPPPAPTPTMEARASSEPPEFLAYPHAGLPAAAPREQAIGGGRSDAPVALGAESEGPWPGTPPAGDRAGSGVASSPSASRWRVGLFIAAVAGLMGAVLRVTLGDSAEVHPTTATWGRTTRPAATLDVPTERLAPIATDDPSRTNPPLEVLVPPPPLSTASTQAPALRRSPAPATPAPAARATATERPSTPAASMPCAPAAAPPAVAPCVPSDKLIEHPW